MSLLHLSVYLSLFVQILTGLLDLFALQLKIPSSLLILRQALILELLVQLIEGSFYLWLVLAIRKAATNVTPARYYDWFFTTPTMLFTLMVYLQYLRDNLNHNQSSKTKTLSQFIHQHKTTLFQVFLLNFLMLIIGFLGEKHLLPTPLSVMLGFIPFITYYAIIYREFVMDNSPKGKSIYWYFVVVWSLYGLSALFPYHFKNMCYNILDLFAKNFFGLYLSYLLYVNREIQPPDDSIKT